jgi:hypothetical protein
MQMHVSYDHSAYKQQSFLVRRLVEKTGISYKLYFILQGRLVGSFLKKSNVALRVSVNLQLKQT